MGMELHTHRRACALVSKHACGRDGVVRTDLGLDRERIRHLAARVHEYVVAPRAVAQAHLAGYLELLENIAGAVALRNATPVCVRERPRVVPCEVACRGGERTVQHELPAAQP